MPKGILAVIYSNLLTLQVRKLRPTEHGGLSKVNGIVKIRAQEFRHHGQSSFSAWAPLPVARCSDQRRAESCPPAKVKTTSLKFLSHMALSPSWRPACSRFAKGKAEKIQLLFSEGSLSHSENILPCLYRVNKLTEHISALTSWIDLLLPHVPTLSLG